MAKNQVISVLYKGKEIGKVGYEKDRRKSTFQYHPEFLKESPFPNLFPYNVRKVKNAQVFSGYEGETFRGLPPFIADSLPDFFGNVIFKEWLETSRQEATQISPLEQLTYVGNRGMGALEYKPTKPLSKSVNINLDEITEVAKKVLDLKATVEEKKLNEEGLFNIFKLGTSAGGARPKILVAQHQESGKLIPGDLEIRQDYTHYIVKLGVGDEGYPKEKMEYVYYQMAISTGIEMMPSKLIDDKHFATERFDRQEGEKKHTLTASGMTGWDFKKPDNSSYENLFNLAVDLKLPHKNIQELFRRMVFNVVFANTDDHLKNFSFIFDDAQNKWNLAPAYDLTFAVNPLLNFKQLNRACSINGKRTDLTKNDVLEIAHQFSIRNPKGILQEVMKETREFESLCQEQHIPSKIIQAVKENFVLLES